MQSFLTQIFIPVTHIVEKYYKLCQPERFVGYPQSIQTCLSVHYSLYIATRKINFEKLDEAPGIFRALVQRTACIRLVTGLQLMDIIVRIYIYISPIILFVFPQLLQLPYFSILTCWVLYFSFNKSPFL